MGLTLLEAIRKLIRQDTTRIGRPVGNLHGAVPRDFGELTGAATQTWLVMTVAGRELLSLQEFLNVFSENTSAMSLEVAEDGQVVVTTRASTLAALRTVVTSDRSLNFALEVAVSVNNSAAVYLDGSLVRVVRGKVAVPLSVPPGRHSIHVVAQAPSVSVTAPKTLMLVGETDIPAAPQWVSLSTGYLDAQLGAVANVLRWVRDAEAGHYRVLRRAPKIVGDLMIPGDGEVLEVTRLGVNDTFGLTLQGLQAGRLEVGAPLLAAGMTIGHVNKAVEDEVAGTTAVECRLPLDMSESPLAAVGAVLYTGAFVEIARVTGTSGYSYVEYVDSAVTTGISYEYVLRAAGLVDESVLGPLSQIRYIATGDVSPPGSIQLIAGYPRVLNRLVTAKYVTPADQDYSGTGVYYSNRVINGTAPFQAGAVAGAVVTVPGGGLPAGLQGYSLLFEVEAYGRYVFRIASNTANTITLEDPVPQELLDEAVLPVDLRIFNNVKLKAHAGVANRQDELSFEAQNYGLYYFVTYDRSGNEQSMADAASWEYTPSQDAFTSPPVLALRQLTDAEQQHFAGVGDVTRYAIVELWAYDPQLSEAAKFDGVTIWYQRSGQDAEPVALTPIPWPLEPFPLLVTGPSQAVLDDPAGVRSRFVPIDREHKRIRVWTSNAQGLTSDITTFIADLNNTPEVSVETYINPLNDTARFVVVADDDTQGFEWQIDDGAVNAVDTRTIKRIEVSDIPLLLGQRKRLVVVPYGTYLPGPPVTLQDSGEAVVREFVRTPRSYVTFENKDADGNRSATFTTMVFSMVPAPAVLYPTGGGALPQGVMTVDGEGQFVLTDTGTPGWTANQYATTSTGFYFLVLRPTEAQQRAPIVRRISANYAGALVLSSSAGLSAYVGIGPIPYQIIDGAVMWRRVVDGVPQGVFRPSLGREVLHKTDEFEVEFYATKNGCYPENVRRVHIDADDLPRLLGFGYVEVVQNGVTYLQVGFGAADDDAVFWEVYERKGGWPTVGGVAPSTEAPTPATSLLRDYLRFAGSTEHTYYRRSTAGMTPGDVWYAVAIPKNSFGQPGIASTAQYTVGGAQPAALTNVVLEPQVLTSNVRITTAATTSTSPATVVTYTATRIDNPNTMVTFTRQVGDPPYDFNVGESILLTSDIQRTWQVTATLAGGNSITRQVSFFVAPPTGANLALTASASVLRTGSCHVGDCGSQQSAPHTRRVAWTLSLAGTPVTDPNSPYYVNVEQTNDGVYWFPIAFGIPAAQQSLEDPSFCMYRRMGYEYWTWQYRLTVTGAGGNSLGVTTTTNTVSDFVDVCAAGDGTRLPLEP
jgi:hypothetical protein